MAVGEPLFSILFAVVLWWSSTGVIAFLDGLPPRTFRWSLLGLGALALGAVAVLVLTADDGTAGGALAAFTAAVVLWGWHEASFLMGLVTGPRRTACPKGCSGLRHFRHAVEAILYHEVALALTALGLAVLLWDAANPVGAWTFLLLLGMRVSAKLNLFLGVPNLGEEFLPPHLTYLASFFRKRPMNLLFPLSVTGATAAVLLLGLAAAAAPDPGLATGFTLLAALAGLALLEHWLMVLPLPSAALWSCFLGMRQGEAGARPAPRRPTWVRPSQTVQPAPVPTRSRVV